MQISHVTSGPGGGSAGVIQVSAILFLVVTQLLSRLSVVDSARRQQQQQAAPRLRPAELRVHVSTRDVIMHPGKSASVTCRVKVNSRVADSLHFGFFMMLGADTSLPMTSYIPGVSIFQWTQSSSRSRTHSQVINADKLVARRKRQTVGIQLVLGPQAYRFLDYGTNKFCCTASIIRSSPQNNNNNNNNNVTRLHHINDTSAEDDNDSTSSNNNNHTSTTTSATTSISPRTVAPVHPLSGIRYFYSAYFTVHKTGDDESSPLNQN